MIVKQIANYIWQIIRCVCAFLWADTRFNQIRTGEGFQKRLSAACSCFAFPVALELVGKETQAGEGVPCCPEWVLRKRVATRWKSRLSQPGLPKERRRPREPRKNIPVLNPLLFSSRFSREASAPPRARYYSQIHFNLSSEV